MPGNLPETDDESPFVSVPVEITVAVGVARPTVREILELGHDSVLHLDRRADDPVELYAGSRLIARGCLEETDDGATLTVRVTEIVSSRS